MAGALPRGFLDDILANPEDDTPRLVYADWLQENGDEERAEFIRAQVELARLPAWDARRVRLGLRERQLLSKYQARWLRELPRIKGVEWIGFSRGMPAWAQFHDFSTLRLRAAEVWAAAPLETASVYWARDDSRAFLPLPALRGLHVQGTTAGPEVAARLADSPLLSTLHVLGLGNCYLGDEPFARLLASPHLGGLRGLLAPMNYLGDGAMAALARAASLASLEELDLSGAGDQYGLSPVIGQEGMESLAAWPGLARLRRLTLTGNNVGAAGLRALLRSPPAAGLKELTLRHCGLGAADAAEFGEADAGVSLEALDLGTNVLRNEGVRHLTQARCLAGLRSLELPGCELRLGAARALARAPFLACLGRLNLDFGYLGTGGMRALLEARPAALHTLHLADNGIDDEGASWLASAPGLDGLLRLDLNTNQLTNAAARTLGAAVGLKGLVSLRLGYNLIDKHGQGALKRSPLAKRLASLSLGGDEAKNPF